MAIGSSGALAALRQQMDAALAALDLPGYVTAESDLEDLHLEQAGALMQAGDFLGAVAQFTTVRDLNLELIEVLDRAPAGDGAGGATAPADGDRPDGSAFDAARVRPAAEHLVTFADANIAFASGQANRTGRDPGAAVKQFARATELFERLSQDDDGIFLFVMARYADALHITAAGQEELIRGNNDAAASEFQRAKIKLGMLKDDPRLNGAAPADGEDDDPALQAQVDGLRATLEREAAMLESLFHVASVRDQAGKGNTAAALTHSEQLVVIQEAIAAGLTDDVPAWIRFSFEAERSMYLAQHETLRGQDLQSRQRWDEALAAFEQARGYYRNGAEAALKTGLPQAGAVQETLLQQAATTIDTAIRQCTTERALREQVGALEHELEWFRSSLAKSLRGANVTVNSNAEAINEVEQRVEISQRFEQSVRLTLDNLRDATEQSGLDDDTKRAIVGRLAELDAEDASGPGFLKKAKGVLDTVAGIVVDAGKIAAPLLPLVNAALLLL